MERVANNFCKLLAVIIGIALGVMVLLVFGNVVLRYGFNSSIVVSEELSRWIFVWLTFLGAVIAIREHGHLGTDLLISRLPPAGKKLCLALSYIGMLYICWLIFEGSLEQTRINAEVLAPSTQLPMGILYAAGVVFATLGAVMLLLDLWLLLSGRLRDDQLQTIRESEDKVELKAHSDANPPDAGR